MGKWQHLDMLGRIALALSIAFSLPRYAAAEPEHIRIDYGAPDGCPSVAEFMQSLRERTKRFQDAAENEEARRMVVRVTPADARYVGRLEIQRPDGTSAPRKVEGKVCEEVVDALALMTALAIDPDVLTRAKVHDGTPPPPSSQPLGPQNESTPRLWSVGVLGQALSGISPTLGYGGSVFIETQSTTASSTGPAYRAGLQYFQSSQDVTDPTGATTRFRWAYASFSGCPFPVAALDVRVTISPCLALSLGILHGQALGISQPKQSVSLWSDVAAELGVRVVLTSRLSLEAHGALIFPMTRPRFAILDRATQQSTLLYAVPRVGGSMGIGLSYRFR